MRIVIAIGGNALLPRGSRPDAAVQVDQLSRVAPALGNLARNHQVLIVHGNGPQVGMLALESGADADLSAPYPLDDLVAETQGMIGYWLQQTIGNHSGRSAVTLISQTIVDRDDPAFEDPTKFIGPVYDSATAQDLHAAHGWTLKPDGDRWRRVVPSPVPCEIVETDIAARLLDAGVTVILAGGGGVPVAYRGDQLVGVAAVVDKDLAAARVAEEIDADLLLILTDVAAVMTDFGTPGQRPLGVVTPGELEELSFPAGSMGPKVCAASHFVQSTARRAAIGALDDVDGLLLGSSGTQIVYAREREPVASGRTP